MLLKTRILVLGLGLMASLSAYAQTHLGFSGQFAPGNWQAGSNAPVNLVDTSAAPSTVKLSNYAPWATSGVTFNYMSAPSDGTVTFRPTLNGSTPNCMSTYWYGQSSQIQLANGTPSSPVIFRVSKGDSFGFAINGANIPSSFGCNSSWQQITLSISDFTFTPELLPFTSKLSFNGKCMHLDVNQPTQQLQVAACNNSENQLWTYERGTGLIRSLVSDKCLDAYFIAYMFTCHGGMNQQWDLLPSGQIQVRSDGKCLDVDAPNSLSAMVNMASCNDTTNQRWSSVSELGVLVNGSSFKCLDVDAASLRVQSWECHGGVNQQWSYNQATSQIRSADFAGKCLYAPEDSQSLRMSQCSADSSQQWDFNAALGIYNRGRNQCVDLFDFNQANGANVVAWACNGLTNQRWYRVN